VEQLLTLARSDPHEPGPVTSTLALEPIAAQALGDCHALAVARGIDLSLQAAHGPCIRGDGEALRTLIRNLVDNAVRYTPGGGRVSVRCFGDDNGGVVLEVADSGPGIAPRDRLRAFDRFHRLSAEQTGSGLGLAIVKAIAQRHGATISLDAGAPGGALPGLCARVYFPAAA
jgi:two-component system OmpR family sensor kinase